MRTKQVLLFGALKPACAEAIARSAQPTGDVECLAGNPRRIRGGEEDDGRCDVLRLSDATQWSGGFGLLAKIAVGNSCRMHALGLHHSGIDGVDADVARPELLTRMSSAPNAFFDSANMRSISAFFATSA